ncbi:MAG: ATP synthase F1 subunit epsilon [candidate division Zixibacteria bacterium]|nr:ATP synthase F1 subunit epsilon [candidate division Zixibacteria bacterium]MDH3938949.1 ATP synthase F1 subunit epsilon [candidate division Zixibacteria bacterium]MDH4033960.1 ATP synthase F1 subunit epsilon [candidate division Zixibacteria bacterium]
MFRLSIVTPEKTFFEADIKSLVVPGTEGYLGVLSNHAPLITALKPGRIEFRDADDRVKITAVSGGFLEVSNNVATLLADAAEFGDDIDIERAQAAYDRERNRLVSAGAGETDIDLPSVRAAVERAANRIKVYKETHR